MISDYPQPGALISLQQAQEECRCRICGEGIDISRGGFPAGWQSSFGSMLFPVAVTLNFGDEFAHPQCLEEDDEG